MVTPKGRKYGSVGITLWLFLFWLGVMILPPPASSASLPINRVVMDNGLVLLIVPRPSLPIVNLRVIIKAGSLHDPQGKDGLAYLVAELLDEGTPGRSSTEIADAVEFVGGRLGSGGGKDWASASLGILKKDLHLGMDIIAIQEGVLGTRGFVALEEQELVCSEDCLRDHVGKIDPESLKPFLKKEIVKRKRRIP